MRDPLGGINSLWPLFGIANQMLAAIALCLATTIILKMALLERRAPPGANGNQPHAGTVPNAPKRSPWLALITLIPLVWLLAVTFTAGVQKILHPDPRIGFLAQARQTGDGLAATDRRTQARGDRRGFGADGATVRLEAVRKELRTKRTLVFNNLLDAVVAGVFLVLVTVIVVLSVREWLLLLSRRKPAVLHETEPVWLPDYAVAEGGGKFSGAAGAAALALALAKELSGEAAPGTRAATGAGGLRMSIGRNAQQVYLAATEQRFNGVRRCC